MFDLHVLNKYTVSHCYVWWTIVVTKQTLGILYGKYQTPYRVPRNWAYWLWVHCQFVGSTGLSRERENAVLSMRGRSGLVGLSIDCSCWPRLRAALIVGPSNWWPCWHDQGAIFVNQVVLFARIMCDVADLNNVQILLTRLSCLPE